MSARNTYQDSMVSLVKDAGKRRLWLIVINKERLSKESSKGIGAEVIQGTFQEGFIRINGDCWVGEAIGVVGNGAVEVRWSVGMH